MKHRPTCSSNFTPDHGSVSPTDLSQHIVITKYIPCYFTTSTTVVWVMLLAAVSFLEVGFSPIFCAIIFVIYKGSHNPTSTRHYYVWTFWSECIEYCMDLDTFIILCRGLFLPEFLSNRLQTFVQWFLCIGEVCSESYVMFCGIYSGFSGSLCGSMLVQLCTCREKPMNDLGKSI